MLDMLIYVLSYSEFSDKVPNLLQAFFLNFVALCYHLFFSFMLLSCQKCFLTYFVDIMEMCSVLSTHYSVILNLIML